MQFYSNHDRTTNALFTIEYMYYKCIIYVYTNINIAAHSLDMHLHLHRMGEINYLNNSDN